MEKTIFLDELIKYTAEIIDKENTLKNTWELFPHYKKYYQFLIENKRFLFSGEFDNFLEDCKEELSQLFWIDKWRDANTLHFMLFESFCSAMYFLPEGRY